MLRELHISGLGVIDDLDVPLHPGLNVLTGETGAGKTMITVGLALALGARANASLVRDGADAARVQALFEMGRVPSEAWAVLDGWVDDGEVLLARTIPADGKGTARIGGQLATASALATLGPVLVEVHGQGQTQRLLEPAVQTAFLDRYAGDRHLVALAAFRETHDALQAATAAFERLRDAARERERELDLLAYQVREIEAVSPEPGESERLASEEARLGHVERLMECGAAAEAALAGDDSGAADALGLAARAIEEAGTLDPEAHELAARGAALAIEVAELARDVRGYRESLAVDPERLQLLRERIAALKSLQRRYGDTDADVLSFMAEASRRLAELAGADERLAELGETVEALTAQRVARAALVTAGREGAADRLAAALGAELEELGMPGARVEVGLDPLTVPGPSGAERVELRFAGGPDLALHPLAKSASGGELSRTMLACRSVMADLDSVPTLVFDEVDAGIGGRAGLAVGRRLARLALDRQVLVVTHLPQIACFADRHVQVTKRGGTASAQVLDDEERVRELSRMLAGLDRSESAISHAEELLVEARRVKATA
ncbi:MAG TPA: DNA repair protein RecN [Actinomycetota bacterium]|nr:DNA repair protein RecN [Actinomycetota bacterium]